MPVYTVHAPVDAVRGSSAETDRFVFVRDGFHFWALVFGPLWLAWHRLWLALLGYIAVVVALGVTLALLRAGGNTRLVVMVLLAVLMGLEAANLRRWTFSRWRWRQVDFIVADDAESAEQRFFDRWTAPEARASETGRNGPGAPVSSSLAPSYGQPARGVIGLFPEPGTSR